MVSTMKPRALAMAALIASGAATQAGALSGGMNAFAGTWRVAGVAVPDAGVQALSDNDPSLMGKRLTFTPARLAWNQPPATGDVCTGPKFERTGTPPPPALRPQLRKLGMRAPVGYALHCRSGSWGPETVPLLYVGEAGAVAMPWYDGGMLKLVRR